MKETLARNIGRGEFFRKRKGIYVFVRISDSSANFLGLDPTKIHGVCFNGNTCSIDKDKIVMRSELSDFYKNIEDNKAWHEQITGKSWFKKLG